MREKLTRKERLAILKYHYYFWIMVICFLIIAIIIFSGTTLGTWESSAKVMQGWHSYYNKVNASGSYSVYNSSGALTFGLILLAILITASISFALRAHKVPGVIDVVWCISFLVLGVVVLYLHAILGPDREETAEIFGNVYIGESTTTSPTFASAIAAFLFVIAFACAVVELIIRHQDNTTSQSEC